MYSKKASYVQFSIQFMHLTKCLKHNHEGLSQNYQKGTNKRSLMTSFLYDDMYIPNNNKKNLSSFSQFVKDTKSFRHIMWQIFFCKLNGNDISNKGAWEFVLYWQNINLFIVKCYVELMCFILIFLNVWKTWTIVLFFQIKVALSSYNPFFLEEYYFNFDYVMVTYKINE